jgi:hypothetical protein
MGISDSLLCKTIQRPGSNFVKEGISLDYCFGNKILFKLQNFGQRYILIASEITCFDFSLEQYP